MSEATDEAILVTERPIDSLKAFAQNPRTHSQEQIAQIAGSILEFGFTNPVLVSEDGEIIAGHGRVLAAQSLGRKSVPVIVLTHLNPAQRRAYVIADNKLALNAAWDEELLRAEIEALALEDFDIGALGFSDEELTALLAERNEGLVDPDDIPPIEAEVVSLTGDIWVLGHHRLACADATNAEDVARTLDGASPRLLISDPPYGVGYDANWRNEADRANGLPYGAQAVGKVENDQRVDWSDAWRLFKGDVAYIWHAGRHASVVQASLEDAGFLVRSQIIWAKTRLIISRGDYHWQHEPCWYAVRKGRKSGWSGDRSQTTLWLIDHAKSETGHSTQKPVECMRRPMLNNSRDGEHVYDPFVGSGTTIIAAEMEGRKCIAIEISPTYVDVAVRRWEQFTGRQAILKADGRTFEQVADERRRS